MQTMMKQLEPAIRAMLFFLVVTGIAYPLVVTVVAQTIFPDQANGSVISSEGEPVGSSLVGQSFVDAESGRTLPGYFRGRPSAVEYNASASGASNLGPTSATLHDRIEQDTAIIRDENRLAGEILIPIDLVTASGSGLDPHISPASAELQISRVARERGLPEDQVRSLVRNATDGPALGLFGEAHVNVVELNIELDRLSGQ